ncbi:MAG: VacJ family lipoprotein [Methylophilaceae bacterium]
MNIKNYKTYLIVGSLLATSALSGCATQANKDPLEGLNRGVYKFNDVTDKAVIKPVAKAYKAITPTPIRIGINNFFTNLGSITTVVNDLLQFKFANAFTDTGRFVINSTFGLAGLIDLAGKDNIALHKEDFGQTLGFWGVGSGAYLVLPFIGPSSLRDATGFAVDTLVTDPLQYPRNIGQIRLANQLRLAQFIDKRTELLTASDLVDEASLDPYAFTRDAYLQKRENLVKDNVAKKNVIDDEFYEDDVPATAPVEVTPKEVTPVEPTSPEAAPAETPPIEVPPAVETN